MKGKDLIIQTIFFIVGLFLLLVASDSSAVQDTVVQKIFITETKGPNMYWWLSLVGVVLQAVAGFLQSSKQSGNDKK